MLWSPSIRKADAEQRLVHVHLIQEQDQRNTVRMSVEQDTDSRNVPRVWESTTWGSTGHNGDVKQILKMAEPGVLGHLRERGNEMRDPPYWTLDVGHWTTVSELDEWL